MKAAIALGLVIIAMALSSCANNPIRHVFDTPHKPGSFAPQTINDHMYDSNRPEYNAKFFAAKPEPDFVIEIEN